MRHLPAEAAPTHGSDGIHLAASAKVQIFAERRKPEGAPRRTRGGAEVAYRMTAECAVLLTKRKPPEKSG